MGSLGAGVNLLEYLKSKSAVDCDCLDEQLATELGPFVDCTSNQADAYLELLTPPRAALLKKSAVLARQIQSQSEYRDVTFEELAVEISMINLSLNVAPLITGAIHVMANPTLLSTHQIVTCAQRISSLCHRIQPSFDMSRLCIKVVSTWEGLQACRELSRLGIKTLATTLFTFEQAVLAAEAGCAYIAPFVHELKAFFDETYKDGEPIIPVCLRVQTYYKMFLYKTRVKAAGLLSVEEAMRLAGIDSMTVAPDLLRTLSKTEELASNVDAMSVFEQDAQAIHMERMSFVADEVKFREAFAKSDNGKGPVKTAQAIAIFCDYQTKAEALMRDWGLAEIG